MRLRFAVLHDVGNDVPAEIVAGIGVLGIPEKQLAQEGPLEDVNPHRGQRVIRIARDTRRIGRFFKELCDAVVLVDLHHAKGRRLHPRDRQAADGDVRLGIHMLPQHQLVIHLVDVVTGEDEDIVDIVAVNDVNVLRYRVGGADIPLVLIHTLGRGQDVEIFVPLGPEKVPAALAMPDQAVRLVLRRNRHLANARVQRIRKREVDDARLAAKIDSRFDSSVGQLLQTASAPARQNERHGPLGQAAH